MATTVKDILSIQLEDDIKTVIDLNSQNEDDVLEELNGFILTESLARHLTDFCDLYVSGTKQSGLWLSGFYGSGKSYFAKMIGYLLGNPILQGTSMRDRFKTKLAGLPDEQLIEQDIEVLGKTRNHIVLFDCAKQSGSISQMMIAAFLRSLGYLDNWMGFWEFDLAMQGKFGEFSDRVQAKFGKPWNVVKRNLNSYKSFRDVLLSWDEDEDSFNTTRRNIEDRMAHYDAQKLSEDLARFLDNPATPYDRIVFLVDEVSEAIAQKKVNFLDLEGMSEALVAQGRRIWTIAIAQLKLDDVITVSGLNKNMLTKLIDRFKNRMNIEADEVDTIIRRRLLAKSDEGNRLLSDYYEAHSGMIQDLTNLNAAGLKPTAGADTYASYYPFFEHQFKMLQYFLFGNQALTKTQVGTRGMVISAFDILKKEAVKDRELFNHVEASQLCRQAEQSPDESLRNRYDQAEALTAGQHYKFVTGRNLLQAIHFLSQAQVIQTTVDHIAKSYTSCPDDFFKIKEEVADALDLLVRNNILIQSGNQYRITSETEQRIIKDMQGFDIPIYRQKSEIVKALKLQPAVHQVLSCNVDGQGIDFSARMSNDDPLSSNQSSQLRVVFHDIFAVQGNEAKYIDDIKRETQALKDVISIIPTSGKADTILHLAEEILRMNELEAKTYSTDEEKKIVASIVSGKDDKVKQLNNLLQAAYANGMMVYCYNVTHLSPDNYKMVVDDTQRRMYGNIFTRRLASSLSDSLAPKIIKTGDSQLHTLFSSDEFRFFDTSGQFIGDHLSVVTELMAQAKAYITGADLEKNLTVAPTGYSFGTIISSVAALFRGSKLIMKFGGEDFHSYRDKGVDEIFASAKKFSKAAFKAVVKSLSYKEKQDIVDILRDACDYRKWTDSKIDYKTNDFELADAIRQLSLAVMRKIKDNILLDEEREKLFHRSVQAYSVFQPYTSAVTDINYITRAKSFLDENNQDDFINAIEIVDKDLKFIAKGFEEIREEKDFIGDVEEELDKSGVDKSQFLPLKDNFIQMYETNLVANATQMRDTTQKIKDFYFKLMKGYAERMADAYEQILISAKELISKLGAYPKAWNLRLYNEVDGIIGDARKYQKRDISLRGYTTRCGNTGFELRDIIYATDKVDTIKTRLAVLETEIVTIEPAFKPVPQPKPDGNPEPAPQPKPQPKQRNMHAQLPSGKLSVAEYGRWLRSQLAQLSQFGHDDILNFE